MKKCADTSRLRIEVYLDPNGNYKEFILKSYQPDGHGSRTILRPTQKPCIVQTYRQDILCSSKDSRTSIAIRMKILEGVGTLQYCNKIKESC